MLGIIGAMANEVEQLKDKMTDVEISTKATMEFYYGKMSGKDVVIVQSGIGKVNAAVCAQILIDDFDVTGIVNTGVAGSLRPEINIGDIVISTDAVEHDMNVMQLGYERGVIPGAETSVFVADDDLIELTKKCCEDSVDVDVFEGRVVSGDIFVSDKKIKAKLIDKFDAFCTEMEGGAIAHCACLNKVPFVVIRSISDKADDSAHMDYPEFEAMAIKNSVSLIESIIANYKGK
ncbi:MAG: 5'-methylthioadenosine/adenosylhomocysteine nucleosidase [Lachnospiraceae bacterium]|nr:5'-methylthioadenosine/adenosylhomocysteine nucleosidase [Lachnospiraceae bacterium]